MLIPIRLTLERYSFARAIEVMTDDDFAELGKQIWLLEEAGKANDLLKLVEADLARTTSSSRRRGSSTPSRSGGQSRRASAPTFTATSASGA